MADITIKKLLEQLPFDKFWKKQFLQRFDSMDADRKYLAIEVLWDTWEAVVKVRRDEILGNNRLLYKYAEHMNITILGGGSPIKLDKAAAQKLAEEDLEKDPNYYRGPIISFAEEILRQVMGLK